MTPQEILTLYNALGEKLGSWRISLFQKQTGINRPLGGNCQGNVDQYHGDAGIFYNTHVNAHNLLMALTLAKRRAMVENVAFHATENDRRLKEPQRWQGELEGMVILEIGSGPIPTFARVARYLGAKVITLDYCGQEWKIPGSFHDYGLHNPCQGLPLVSRRLWGNVQGEDLWVQQLEYVPAQPGDIPSNYATGKFIFEEEREHLYGDFNDISITQLAQEYARFVGPPTPKLPPFDLIVADGRGVSNAQPDMSWKGWTEKALLMAKERGYYYESLFGNLWQRQGSTGELCLECLDIPHQEQRIALADETVVSR